MALTIGGKKRKSRKVHKGGNSCGVTPKLSPVSLNGGKRKSKKVKKGKRVKKGGLANVATPLTLLALRQVLKGSLKRHRSRKPAKKSRGRK